MADHPDSVNSLLMRCHKVLERADLSETTRAHYTAVAQALKDAQEYASSLEREVVSLSAKLKPLPSRLGDLSDLPEELRAELSVPRTDELENQIMVVIQSYGGTADLDQILIGLFRNFKIVQKRKYLQQRAWKLCQKNMIWSIRGKKGVYTLNEPAEEEKEKIPKERDELDDEIPF